MSPSPRVALVVQRAWHHAGHSGYHQLAEHLVARGAAVRSVHRFPRRGSWRLAQPLARRSGLAWYGPEAFLTEAWSAAVTAWRHPVLHFLQGENSYRYAAAIPGSPRRRLVATFHLPPSVFAAHVGLTAHLERLDALVFVARNQLPLLERLRGRPPAYVVPHGIDTTFFRPGHPARAEGACLMVGRWLRDFSTLQGVVDRVRRARAGTRFVLVLPRDLGVEWRGHPGVEVQSDLDDIGLLRVYQEAALLVMPLHDCTANNAILEAMACGLPLVVTDIGGVRDYVEESCAFLIPPQDADGMAGAVIDLLQDVAAREAMGRAARARAETFAWPRIAERILEVYASLR